MSDIEIIREMFTRNGIEFTEDTEDSVPGSPERNITVEDGYRGFIAVFDFDESGTLKRVSAWE